MSVESTSNGDKTDRPRGGGGGGSRRPFSDAEKPARSPEITPQKSITRIPNCCPDTYLSGVKLSRAGLQRCPQRGSVNWREQSRGLVFWLSCHTFRSNGDGPVPGAAITKRNRNA